LQQQKNNFVLFKSELYNCIDSLDWILSLCSLSFHIVSTGLITSILLEKVVLLWRLLSIQTLQTSESWI